MNVDQDLIVELRDSFFNKLNQEQNNECTFHVNDVKRVKDSDVWLKRFIVHTEGNVNTALGMLWSTCEWRKSMNVNDITEGNIHTEYFTDGSLFSNGCDKDGKNLLVFRCKMHIKGQKDFEELKLCLIYWFERLERQTNGDQITIFFDMTDSGLSNLDMEFTKYLINLIKMYYPSFVNYILIFEMPWILNAAFKIIKSWLPARAVEKIKFIDRSNIKEYVTEDNILKQWGGAVEYEYCFKPELQRYDVPCTFATTPTSLKSTKSVKKNVSFALEELVEKMVPTLEKKKSSECLIKVIHPEIVHFNWNGTEFTALINLENMCENNILYKVKTTSPDRYRVRPNSGLLQRGVITKIMIILQNGYTVHSILKDKFLVMAKICERETASSQEVLDLWKHSEGSSIEQHRLKCSVNEPLPSILTKTNHDTVSAITDELVEKIEHLSNAIYQMRDCNTQLHKDVEYREKFIIVLLLFIAFSICSLIFVVYTKPFSSSTSLFDESSCPINKNTYNHQPK